VTKEPVLVGSRRKEMPKKRRCDVIRGGGEVIGLKRVKKMRNKVEDRFRMVGRKSVEGDACFLCGNTQNLCYGKTPVVRTRDRNQTLARLGCAPPPISSATALSVFARCIGTLCLRRASGSGPCQFGTGTFVSTTRVLRGART